MNDHRDVALVFDMRSESRFNSVQLCKSINFAIEKVTDDTFIQWSKEEKKIAKDKSICKNKYTAFAFEKRKRHWCFVIGAHSSQNLNEMIMHVTAFSDKSQFDQLIQWAQTDQ